MIVYSTLLIFITVSYSILIILLLIGFENLPLSKNSGSQITDCFVSLVIPFRNEENRLPELIKSLKSQTCPADCLEVIFVDDHSEDRSFRIISELCSGHANYKLLSLGADEEGKKSAILTGVKHSVGDYIIQTDADIMPGKDFIKEHITKIIETDADLIAGPVACKTGKNSLFGAVEAMDILSLTATGAGSYYYDNPIMCSAANLSYRRSFFFEAEPLDQGKLSPSGDDMFLLIAARKLRKKIAYLKSRQAVVFTYPSASLRAFMRQRIRWASKTKYYNDRDILWIAVMVAITNLALVCSPFLLFCNRDLFSVILSCFILKAVADFALIAVASAFTKQVSLLRFYPLAAILYYFYIVYVVAASLFRRLYWKERSYLARIENSLHANLLR